MKRLFLLPLILLFCAGIARSQIQYPKGSLAGSTTVAALPLIGNSNILWDVRDGNPNCGTGGGTTRVVCRWNGATYDTQAVVGGAGVGTVTSVSASGGTETTTGSAITSTGTIRSVQTIRTAAGDPTAVLDADRGKVLNVTFAGGSEIDIAQAGTAGSFASGWYTDVKCSGAGGCQIIPTVSTINGAAFYNLTSGQTVRVVSDGTNYKTTLTGGSPISGLTTNTIPKATSATAIGDSQITDDGTVVNFPGFNWDGNGTVTINSGDFGGAIFTKDTKTVAIGGNSAGLNLDGTNGVKTAGIVADTESLTIDGTAHTITNTAATSIGFSTPLVSFPNVAYQGCTALSTNGGGDLVCTVSTVKQKQGFHLFTDGLNAIRKIQPQTFSFIKGSPSYDGGRMRLGLIAENLQAANPLLVSKTGLGVLQPEPLALNALMIDAIKTLDTRLTLLERENKRLRRRLRRLSR